jgi:hypothetical protein
MTDPLRIAERRHTSPHSASRISPDSGTIHTKENDLAPKSESSEHVCSQAFRRLNGNGGQVRLTAMVGPLRERAGGSPGP